MLALPSVQITRMMLLAGADPKARNNKHQAAQDIAPLYTTREMVQNALTGKVVRENEMYGSDFIHEGDIEGLSEYIDNHPDAIYGTLNRVQYTSLAAKSGNLKMLQMLVKRGAPVEGVLQVNGQDQTILTEAVRSGNPQLIKWVLDNYPQFPVRELELHLARLNIGRTTWPYSHNTRDCRPEEALALLLNR